MKINCRLEHVYQDCDERLDTLDIYLEEGERIAVGEVLDIPMMDGSTIQREVKALNPQSAGDFAPISDAIARGVAEGRNHVSISPVNTMCASLRNLSTSSCRALGTSSQERISPTRAPGSKRSNPTTVTSRTRTSFPKTLGIPPLTTSRREEQPWKLI